MKKKKLLILLATAALLMSACAPKKKPASESEGPESEPGTSEVEPSEPVDESEEESEPEESEPEEEIEHQAPFVTNVGNPSITRQYRSDFDAMIEDFSGATPSGTTTGAYTDPFLRVLVDSEDENEPQTPDAAIYKMATGSYALEAYEGIGFKMRVAGHKAIKYSNLVLGLRGDDAYKVYELNLADALDPDQEELPALSEEWQDVIISPQQSIDADVEYELKDGGSSGATVLSKYLGFHLYALDEECSAVIEIKEVFLYNAGERTTLDAFARADVGKPDDTCYWRGSTGFIVQRGATLEAGQAYTTKDIEELTYDYDYLVLNVLGDTTGAKLNDVKWEDLVDPDGNSVSGAVNGAFMSYVIDPALSGVLFDLEASVLTLTAAHEIVIAQVFLTNLQNEVPVTEYPLIDTENAVIFDDYNWEMTNLPTNYEEGNSEANQTIADAGLYYAIAWRGAEHMAVTGGELAIAGGDYEYVQFTEASQGSGEGMHYLVFVIKNGANLNELRIAAPTGSQAVYANDWVAGPGLPTIPVDKDNYVYNDGEYSFYIIDIERSGLTATDSMDIYYTGTEDLHIKGIFFANAYDPNKYVEEVVRDLDVEATDAGYQYVTGYDIPADVKYLHIETTATEADGIRFENAGSFKWLNGADVIDINGNPVPAGAKDFVIDLAASGLDGANIHVHSNGVTNFHFTMSTYKALAEAEEEVVRDLTIEATDAGYQYVTGYDIPADVKYLHIETNATEADGMRFENAGTFKWLNGADVIDINGDAVPAGATDFIIDLKASELDGAAIHVHSNGVTAFHFKMSTYKVNVPTTDIELVRDVTIEATDAGYQYVTGYDIPAGTKYLHIETNATEADGIRFENSGSFKWLNGADVIDVNGNPVPAGAKDFVIDLVASGLDGAAIHVHSNGVTAFNLKMSLTMVVGSYDYLMAAITL